MTLVARLLKLCAAASSPNADPRSSAGNDTGHQMGPGPLRTWSSDRTLGTPQVFIGLCPDPIRKIQEVSHVASIQADLLSSSVLHVAEPLDHTPKLVDQVRRDWDSKLPEARHYSPLVPFGGCPVRRCRELYELGVTEPSWGRIGATFQPGGTDRPGGLWTAGACGR